MLSDPDLLDVTRKLRTYLSSLDNSHVVLEKVSEINDSVIVDAVYDLTPEIVATTQKISATLKKIEASKQYRDMIKRYNIEEDENDEI